MNSEERRANTARRAERILEIAARMASIISISVENQIEEIRLHYEGYAEPGYDVGESGLVATGNWNSIDQYDRNTNCRKIISDLPKRICDLFEKMGIECEWSDEWYECSCGKLVRLVGDSYSWTPSFVHLDCEIACIDCILEDPKSYLFSIESNYEMMNTIHEIDPADHGYVLVNEESYESGWHPGQNDNPTKIASELESRGIYRYVFSIDSVGQFSSHWSVYVHKDEEHFLNVACNTDEGDDCEDCSHCTKDKCVDNDWDVPTIKTYTVVNANDSQCKVCKTCLNMGETPCWKCGTNDPTEV